MTKVVFIPGDSNLYQNHLSENLRELDVEVTYRRDFPSERWLIQKRGDKPILHLHWLHELYVFGDATLPDVIRYLLTPFKFIHFVFKVILARLLGYQLVWTAHNLLPHRTIWTKDNWQLHRLIYFIFLWSMDVLARFLIVHISHSIIAHCHYAVREIHHKFLADRRKFRVIPHGTFVNDYPATISRQAAREKLNLPLDAFVYLFFGAIKPYKGVDVLLNAFSQITEPDAHLLIGGRPIPERYGKTLAAMTAHDQRIHLDLAYIPDEEVQVYFMAADVTVIPFRDALTSGSIMLPLAFGHPVITSRVGCIPELIDERVGIIYDSQKADELLLALQTIRKHDLKQMGANARALADHKMLKWSTIAEKTKAVYLGQHLKQNIVSQPSKVHTSTTFKA